MIIKCLKIIITVIFVLALLTALLIFLGIKTGNASEEIEKKLIYRPSKQTFELIPEFSDKAEEGSFIFKGNTKSAYIRIKGTKKTPVIVFCHGNNGNMTLPGNQKKMKFLIKQGYEVFMFDYPGFGKSEGVPDEEKLYASLDAFISHLNDKYKISMTDTVLWGHSLGSAVVIDTAARQNFKGVITEGAFTSTEEMKKYTIENKRTGNPACLFLRDYIYKNIKITQKFDSKSKISRIKSPMLIMHGINDNQIPYAMSMELAGLKPDAITYFSETGDHNDYDWQEKPVMKFLKKSD